MKLSNRHKINKNFLWLSRLLACGSKELLSSTSALQPACRFSNPDVSANVIDIWRCEMQMAARKQRTCTQTYSQKVASSNPSVETKPWRRSESAFYCPFPLPLSPTAWIKRAKTHGRLSTVCWCKLVDVVVTVVIDNELQGWVGSASLGVLCSFGFDQVLSGTREFDTYAHIYLYKLVQKQQ